MIERKNAVISTPSLCHKRLNRLSRAQGWLWLAIMLLTVPLASLAQDTRATLGGKVLDPQGAAIAGATVTVTAEATGVQTKVNTNGEGNWRAPYLVPGPYHFDVEANGFKTARRAAIQLQLGDQKFLDVTLEVGAKTDTITVESAPPLIDTTAAVSGTVITTEHLAELPTLSGIPTTLAGLTPGVVVGDPNGGTSHLWSNISASKIDVNGAGSGTRAIGYTLDGATNTNSSGQVTFIPPMEAVSEFRVITNAYDASLGGHGAATINMSLKSGTQGFHGSLYENNQNNSLNARPYNSSPDLPLPAVHVNDWGGTFGGPVLLPKLYDGRKKQTFFFLSYDGIRNTSPSSTSYASIPTMAERTGDFSQSWLVKSGKTYPISVYDPNHIEMATGNRPQFSGNVIPTGQINPISAAILKLMPAPNVTNDASCSNCKNYLSQALQNDKFASLAMKFDQNWNNSHHSYVSLRWNSFSETSQDTFGATNPLQGLDQYRTNKGITIDHTWVVSPTYIADFRYNVTGYMYKSMSPGAAYDPTTLGFPSSYVALMDTPSIPLIRDIASGMTQNGLGTNKKNFNQDTFQTFTANLTQTKGNHTFRYGVEYDIQQQGVKNLGAPGGTFRFDSKWTIPNPLKSAGNGQGSTFASYLLGLPSNSSTLPTNATAFWSQHSTGFYFQDDWRATDKLTLNLGLRWDFVTPMSERYNRYVSRFDPNVVLTDITTPAQANYAKLITGTSTSAGVQYLQQYRGDASSFVARGGPLYAGVNGTSRNMADTRYKYWQPRFGFAYRLMKDTVIRGGFGRFAQSPEFTGPGQDGFSQSTSFTASIDNYYTPLMSFNNLYPNGKTAPTGSSNGIYTNPGSWSEYTDPYTGRRPFVDEASLHIQHQVGDYLFEVGGTLNITHDILVDYNVNLPSETAWRAAYGPQFDTNGRPVDQKAGDVPVTNPFLGDTHFLNNMGKDKTLSAYQLSRPNPMFNNLTEHRPIGKATYYGLQAKAERRLKNGFSLLQSFTWSKKMAEYGYLDTDNLNAVVYQQRGLDRQLDGSDRRFLLSTTSTYKLPFGRGKLLGKNVSSWMDKLIGGWEMAGIYSFASGTPLVLPTNNAFYKSGCNPSLGSGKSDKQWFDTSCFVAFPTKDTTYADLHDSSKFPSWTGVQNLPGYNWQPSASDAAKNGVYGDFTTWSTANPTVFGSIRQPWSSNLDLGLRKSVQLTEKVRLQLRMDAFNALNHARFQLPDASVDPSNVYFGVLGGSGNLSAANKPRAVQLSGKITF